MEVRIATIEELAFWWDEEIAENPDDNSLPAYKQIFIEGNKNAARKTFFAFDNGKYIGQCTLLFKNNDTVMTGNGKAEVLKLELIPEERGKGKSTKIYETVKNYAKESGIKTLTIGVEPCEIKNMQIYFHWGFDTFLQCITETCESQDGITPGETITVLCYSQTI